ncbi:MAG: fatty acid desaturase [Candidatus Omnitrophica bacterium]|nr:fatty acid desaturase [Candidatus Omnitrophota bacterium]
MEANQPAVKKMIWLNIFFFGITTLVAVIAGPLYLYHNGISPSEFALFAFYMAATGLSITVGYHRLFAHSTYKAHPIIEFLLIFFGAAAFEQSAYDWSSQHRDHHRYVDTDRDPYSIKKGFWYAHIGWLIFWKHKINYENAKDLQKNKLVMNQHKYYGLWAIGSGILLPVAIGALSGHALGAFIFAVCCRLTLVYHCTFFINSICHMFGKSTYDIYATAKDHWFIALLTYGEGYHNFHHRFPSDYRNGVRWYQWDPSKWMIAFFNATGLAKDLKRVSKFRILDARLAGEKQRAHDFIEKLGTNPNLVKASALLRQQYETVRNQLMVLEALSKEYHDIINQRVANYSVELQKKTAEKLKAAQEKFQQIHDRWSVLMKQDLPSLPNFLILHYGF